MLVLPAIAAATPRFNNSKCPHYWELQAPRVASSFDFSRDVPGLYYELAFHDWTQRPLCPTPPRCITSLKQVRTHADGVRYVNDTWRLQCFGRAYPQTLLFNQTEARGALRGYVPTTRIPFLPESIAAGLVFPDTIVDFKRGAEGWLLEVQCVEALGGVRFVGINFYSKTKTEAAFQEMHQAALDRGLGFWMDSRPWGLSRVNHTDCPDEPHDVLEA
ncbi:hypothetical protein AB1Y20_005012 [Prymnesium parvum]|uniref:Uncharacterized protein n=1 Tax=Prymnesium parvum TaxID=97485 RepID=A0AB34J5B3_PRYPA